MPGDFLVHVCLSCSLHECAFMPTSPNERKLGEDRVGANPLHSVMHRPITKSRVDEQDHRTALPVAYVASRVIASAREYMYALLGSPAGASQRELHLCSLSWQQLQTPHERDGNAPRSQHCAAKD
jgi:hypothetical protein